MNVAYREPWQHISPVDGLLMDVARRIQLTKTKHETAETNYRALCQHVDREGSPLQGKVIECYPSGSFATGTAIASRVAKNQHDVDVVMELDVPPNSPPNVMLGLLFESINGEPGSRYHGMVKQNSRCVTVTYSDGTTVDLMPVARLPGEPDRAGNLFHYKKETQEAYHKAVNPWGFAKFFNDHVEFDQRFYESFLGRRFLVEGMALDKAETQPMPDHETLEEKSPRVVALQLIKRNRDIVFRAADRRSMRKPPSVVLAAIALEAGPVQSSLVDEVISVAGAIRARLLAAGNMQTVVVTNPAHPRDVFTDRWPESRAAQDVFDGDLRRLIVELYRLRNENLSMAEQADVLRKLFGETAANYAIDSNLDVRRHEMEAGKLHAGNNGKIATSAAALAAPTVAGVRTSPVRAATREGGGSLKE